MEFFKQFVACTVEQYRSSIPYLAATYNTSINLQPLLRLDGTTPRIEIQRMKRLTSVKTGVDPRDVGGGGTETATAKYAGNALIERLNKLQSVSWETIGVIPGEEKIIGVSVAPNQAKDVLEDASGYERVINARTKEMMDKTNELILEELVRDTPQNKMIKGLKADGSDNAGLYSATQQAINHIALQVDEFKKYTQHDKLLILMHPDAVSMLGRYKGEIFQSAPELFNTGIESDFHVEGTKGFKEPGINALEPIDISDAQDGSATEKVLAIIYDIEGLASGNATGTQVNFVNDMLAQKYVGTRWYEILKHFDKKRIVILTGTLMSDNLGVRATN